MLSTSTFAAFLIGVINTSIHQYYYGHDLWPLYGQEFCISQTNELGIQLFSKHTLCPVFFLTVNIVCCSGVLRRKKRKFIPKPGMVY